MRRDGAGTERGRGADACRDGRSRLGKQCDDREERTRRSRRCTLVLVLRVTEPAGMPRELCGFMVETEPRPELAVQAVYESTIPSGAGAPAEGDVSLHTARSCDGVNQQVVEVDERKSLALRSLPVDDCKSIA